DDECGCTMAHGKFRCCIRRLFGHLSMPPCTDYLVRRRRAPPSTSLNQPISWTLPLGTLRKWRGELPRGPVLARFCRFDLESTNVDPKLLGDGRSGSSSRTFARAGSSQS